ncbi:MAG: radical SAM protein [Bacteroidetes bacterium]|nr:radical SAM protein [Bacteroidota bacterium]
MSSLTNCKICPRNCGADRSSKKLGYCNSDASFNISSICIHKGEEPIISGSEGICNVFFSRCNLQCVFCQNFQISKNNEDVINHQISLEEIVNRIKVHLDNGCKSVGFVSPSHFIPQMVAIIDELNKLAVKPIIVYNTNAYDKVETIKALEGMVDVYLPDFKYFYNELAKEYSDAIDYPEISKAAIKEMFRQKGATILKDENGIAESGLIIRHLVLPGNVENSIKILNWIADNLSTTVHISLMSQYFPTENVKSHNILNQRISETEYQSVVKEMENLGFYRGWIQELESASTYQPDFLKNHPFDFF